MDVFLKLTKINLLESVSLWHWYNSSFHSFLIFTLFYFSLLLISLVGFFQLMLLQVLPYSNIGKECSLYISKMNCMHSNLCYLYHAIHQSPYSHIMFLMYFFPLFSMCTLLSWVFCFFFCFTETGIKTGMSKELGILQEKLNSGYFFWFFEDRNQEQEFYHEQEFC